MSLVLAALSFLGALAMAHAQEGIIESLTASVEDERTVRFEWTMRPEYAEEQVSCVFDVDADDPATVDIGVTDCGNDTSVDFTYDEPGRYEAALTATSSAGGSDRVLITVLVD